CAMAESTVLVVDDEPLIVDFLAENLRADDYAVLTAGSGTEAISVLRETRPDVVLLDIVLPDLSGYEVCRMVREGDRVNDRWDPDIPIIMLSARRRRRIACAGSRAAPTTTSPSRSTIPSCWPGSARC